MIQINPLKSYIDGGVRAALTTPPSASLVFDLPGKAIWVKGVKLKGTDHTYTFSHDNYITLTNTPDSNESEDIKIGVNTSALKSAIDTTYGVVSTTANGLAPKFTSGNKLAASAATTYYFLGWAGTTLKWYQAPFRNIRINSETTDRLGVNNTDPLIIGSGNGISVTWDSTNKKIVITNTKPDVNHNTDRTGIKLATVSGTKKTDSTLILANSTSGLNIQGGTNKFLIGDGTNYIEVPVTPSFTVSNKDATIGTALTTIATIAGVDIKAKIASYSLSNHTHSVKINGSTKTIAASGAVDLGNYLPLSGGTMTGSIYIPGLSATIIHTTNSSSNYIYISELLTGSNKSATNYQASIGWHNTGGSGNGALILAPYAQNSDPWLGNVGLYIAQNSLKFNGTAISLVGHTHSWNSLTHSSTTENQAILTNGSANGWKLYTLNISGWNNAANNAHSHSNKSVLDGITSTLVSNWNTAYNFVNTISGTDTDKVINKWDEIVNFLAGITEDNKLNTLLNSKLSVYKLADNTDIGAIKNNGIYYSTSDASSGTLINSPFNTVFTLINMTSLDNGDDLRRSRLAFNAYGEVKISNDRGLANTAETWYQVLTSHNTYISNGSGIINGTTITLVSNADTTDGVHLEWSGQLTYDLYSWLAGWTNDGKKIKAVNKTQFATSGHNHDNRYLKLTGGTMQLGEGLKFHADDNYFGSNSDARIISLLDGNGTTCDGGLIIDERCTNNGTTTITELLRIRDNEFKWKGLNILHSGNSSVTKSGQTLTVTINGTSQSLTNNTYNFSGVSFTSGNLNTAEHNANNITSNGIWYYTSNGPATSLGASTNDGALYSQAYSSSWVGQIAQDYRDGDLFTRSKNNNTWTTWKKIAYINDIPIVTNYYWADLKISNNSNAATNPTVALLKATTGVQIGGTADYGWYLYNNRICAGINVARDINAGSLLVSSAWADSSKVPINGIYSKGNILTAGGFIKSGSSNSYVLLGAGGHKAISDFATSGHNHNNSYVASVSISGNNLRINKNGINTDLTIPYATNADKIDGYHEYNFSHSWRANAYLYTKFITITRSSEKGFIRLHCAVEDNSGIKGADYIIHWLYDGSSENKSITINCLSSYGSNADTSVYAVRKSGTLFDLIFKALSSGAFYVGFSVINYSSSCTINNYDIAGYTEETKPQATYTSSAMSLITDITGNAVTASKLGTSTVGATNVPIYLNGGTPTTVNLNSTANNLINNLSVGDSVPADNDYYIAQYVNGGTTTTSYHRRPHSALYAYIKNKAEGTWNISINGNAKGLSNNGDLNSQEEIDSFLTANTLKYAIFRNSNFGFAENDGMILSIPWSSANYGFQMAFDDTTYGTVKVRGKNNSWGNWYTLLHSGNSNVSGGGSTWGSSITVNINGTSKTLTIPGNPNTDYRVTQSETTTANYRPLVVGYTNVSTAGSGMTGSVTNQVYLSNKFYVQPSTGNLYATNFVGTLSGNASTATNADKVDGYHASSLWRSDGATWNPGANVSLNASGNNQEWSFDIRRNGYTGCYWHVWDSALNSLLKVNADNGKVYAPYNFVGNLEGNATTSSKWATARTITLSGSVTGSISIDGSSNVTLTTTTNHTHNYAGSNSAGGAANSSNCLNYKGTGNNVLTAYQTSSSYMGSDASWASYIICNHGDGSTYYNLTIRMPFWGVPQYQRLVDGTYSGWKTFITSENISSLSVNYASSSGYASSAGNSDTVDGYHASNLVKFYLSPMTNDAPADSAKSWFTNTMPSASGAIVYNVPGSEKTIIAGKSSGAYGHMLQLNYDNTYLRILRYYNGSWKSTDWEKISAGYADLAGSVAWNNVTGKPSSYTPSAHTHSWTSITDKLVAGNEFNIVNAGFNEGMWFNYLPINDRSKTATINGYHFGNGATGYTSIKASGFIKNGSNSSYVLLGDGGHKAESSLSVSYASSAGNADTVDGLHLYTRNLGINGSSWTFASTTTANAAPHIYAATSAGTSGQILKSTGGTPTWINQSDLIAGKITCTVGTADVFRPIVLTNESNQLYYNTKIKGNYLTGKIQLSGIEIEDASGNIPLIRFGSANKNSILWKVYSNDTTYANQGVYGFDMTYFGTGSGNANRLVLHADNQNSATKVEAISITQDGVVTFSKTISGSINGNANTVDGQHFNWNNNKNDHTYLWAATDKGNAYLVHRASISVNYANSAGNADTLDGLHANAFATASHSHPYLSLSGGTMTGVIKSTYTSGTWINGVTNSILKGEYTGYGAILSMPVKDGRVSLSSYPVNDNNIYFGYATTAQINAGTNSFNKLMFWDAANNNLHAGVFTGYLSGNASTASKWLTARTLTIGNTDKSVDGSENVSWTLAEIGAATSGHTHTLSLASDTGTSSITLAHGGKYKLTAGGNSVIFTLPTDNNTNPANYYWANVKVSATSNVGTTPQFGKVKINTTSSTYQLNVGGDSYVTGWSRAAKGFYCHDTGVHFTHNGTKGQIAITSNNEFCWGANNNTLYFNFAAPSLGITVTKYVWNAGSPSTYATHVTGDIILGKNNYLITRLGCTSDWYNGRNNAMIRITSASPCSAITSIKTHSGSWEIGNGVLTNDHLYFSYVSDSAFNSGNYKFVPPLVSFDSSACIYATHFYENSDIRYKKILRNLSINSNTIATLPLFDFEWIENNVIGTGTSALAVLLILPNLVSGTDRLTLDYGVLGTIAGITACKELVTLKSELLQLKEKVKELEDKLRKYENI